MKKWLCMLLCLGMMLAAVGCGAAEQATESEEVQEEQEKEEDTRGIAGSNYYDVCSAMMENGFPQFETSYLAEEDVNFTIFTERGCIRRYIPIELCQQIRNNRQKFFSCE